jgi:hypothetical protein
LVAGSLNSQTSNAPANHLRRPNQTREDSNVSHIYDRRSILADHLDNDQLAVQLHQDFKFRKIAGLPRDKAWSMSEDEVAREVAQIKKNRRP